MPTGRSTAPIAIGRGEFQTLYKIVEKVLFCNEKKVYICNEEINWCISTMYRQ